MGQIQSCGLDKSAQRDEGNRMQMIESANPVLNDAGKWETETGQIHNGGVSKSARRDDDRNTTAMMLTNAGHKRNKWTMVWATNPGKSGVTGSPAGHWVPPPCMFPMQYNFICAMQWNYYMVIHSNAIQQELIPLDNAMQWILADERIAMLHKVSLCREQW